MGANEGGQGFEVYRDALETDGKIAVLIWPGMDADKKTIRLCGVNP